jgi:hypothetical protein
MTDLDGSVVETTHERELFDITPVCLRREKLIAATLICAKAFFCWMIEPPSECREASLIHELKRVGDAALVG